MVTLRKKNVDVPIVAVTGGKGGTGKTMVAVNLAVGLNMEGLKVMLVDADVDGPCCAALLGMKLDAGNEVRTFRPVIEETKCVGCMKCVDACHEHALISLQGETPIFFEELCSGCGACKLVCGYGAIGDGWKTIGTTYTADADGLKLVVGELKPTEPRSPLMARATVLRAISELRNGGYDVAVIDTAPGVHNTVAQPLWVSDLALAVTEPTPLGTHDLKFILALARELELPVEVVLNKADVPGGLKDELLNICHERGIKLTAEIPLDEELLRSYIAGEPLMKKAPNSPAGKALMSLILTIRDRLKGGEI
ncbi:MAG: P-loop NTPase [Candidatus Hadarchaeum sp.]|uniref:P-loop NTPase n=1 Tax=Candidatus Hadarchaeum sp. TaxID=2883567 RepID=UPI003D0A08F2